MSVNIIIFSHIKKTPIFKTVLKKGNYGDLLCQELTTDTFDILTKKKKVVESISVNQHQGLFGSERDKGTNCFIGNANTIVSSLLWKDF